jgi:hypothetical protein
LHGSTDGSRNFQPHLYSSDADEVPAPQLQHPVQDMSGDADLGRPTLILARAHPPSRAWSPVTDDLLVAPDGGLKAAPFAVAGYLLPADPAFLVNALETAVALGWLIRRRCTGYCRRRRRHDDCGLRLVARHSTIDAILVVGAVPVNDGTGSATWPSNEPSCEASSTSFVVRSVATISPVSAFRPICNFRQARRVLVPCFSISTRRRHRASVPCCPPTDAPIQQHCRTAVGVPPRLAPPAQTGWTASGIGRRLMSGPIRPSVWRSARWNTARSVSVVRTASGECHGWPPQVRPRLGPPGGNRLERIYSLRDQVCGESMQSCGVHYAASATTSSPTAGRDPSRQPRSEALMVVRPELAIGRAGRRR